MLTNEGMDAIIDDYIRANTWYLLLIDNVDFITEGVTDGAADHSGWIENTDYTQATRPQITFDAADGSGKTKNSTAVVFTLNANIHYRGFAIVSNNTKGGTTGIILATTILSGPVAEDSGQNISATIEI